METKQTILTLQGLKRLEDELDELKTTKRTELSEKIKQALSFGDLSENSEYDEAKNEQAQVELRIMQLESMIKTAKVIDEDAIDTTVVSIGSRVKVYDVEFDEEIEYSIVGSAEADPTNNKISDESPVGKALLGAEVGQTVSTQVPSGATLSFKILEINR